MWNTLLRAGAVFPPREGDHGDCGHSIHSRQEREIQTLWAFISQRRSSFTAQPGPCPCVWQTQHLLNPKSRGKTPGSSCVHPSPGLLWAPGTLTQSYTKGDKLAIKIISVKIDLSLHLLQDSPAQPPKTHTHNKFINTSKSPNSHCSHWPWAQDFGCTSLIPWVKWIYSSLCSFHTCGKDKAAALPVSPSRCSLLSTDLCLRGGWRQ